MADGSSLVFRLSDRARFTRTFVSSHNLSLIMLMVLFTSFLEPNLTNETTLLAWTSIHWDEGIHYPTCLPEHHLKWSSDLEISVGGLATSKGQQTRDNMFPETEKVIRKRCSSQQRITSHASRRMGTRSTLQNSEPPRSFSSTFHDSLLPFKFLPTIQEFAWLQNSASLSKEKLQYLGEGNCWMPLSPPCRLGIEHI